MKRYYTQFIIVLFILVIFSSFPVYPKGDDFYCYDLYDEYREIKYWAIIHVSVNDYDFKSGDSKFLGLTYNDKKSIVGKSTNKEILDHFNKEFDRLIKGNLPYHDVDLGRTERFREFHKKYGKRDNYLEMWDAQEEARRNSLYGPNPGAVYCIINVSRREFPIIYEMKCSIVANKNLWNRNGLEEKILGYSTPEYIVGELKNSITHQLEELHKKLDIINSCTK